MEFEMNPYSVYVKTNDYGYITAINSSEFITDVSDWTWIDSGYSIKYHHAQNHYLPKPIYIDNFVYRYKLVDGIPTECSEEEIAQQEYAIKSLYVYTPSTEERIGALEAAVTMLCMPDMSEV